MQVTLDAARLALGGIPYKDEPTLTTITGEPWVESHFSTKFSATKNPAALAHLHFHGLRGTAISVLAENGCTKSEIASITGHSMKHIEKVNDTYMARTRQLNDEAVAKLDDRGLRLPGQSSRNCKPRQQGKTRIFFQPWISMR